jgi:hypothetical protein
MRSDARKRLNPHDLSVVRANDGNGGTYPVRVCACRRIFLTDDDHATHVAEESK